MYIIKFTLFFIFGFRRKVLAVVISLPVKTFSPCRDIFYNSAHWPRNKATKMAESFAQKWSLNWGLTFVYNFGGWQNEFASLLVMLRDCSRNYSHRSILKSDNLQYNTLVRWFAGTNDSSTKCLMFQVLFFFTISFKILCKNCFVLFFHSL